MDLQKIIHNAYDNYFTKISKYNLKNLRYEEIKTDDNLGYNYLVFYDGNILKYKCKYYYLGDYMNGYFRWGWSIPMHKNINRFVKELFDYGFNQDYYKNNTEFIKKMLINSIIKIKNIEFLLIFTLYITKCDTVFSIISNNIYEYYLLKDIEEF